MQKELLFTQVSGTANVFNWSDKQKFLPKIHAMSQFCCVKHTHLQLVIEQTLLSKVVYRCNSHANNNCILQCQVSGIVVHKVHRRVAVVWFILAYYLVFDEERWTHAACPCWHLPVLAKFYHSEIHSYPKNSKNVFEIQNWFSTSNPQD